MSLASLIIFQRDSMASNHWKRNPKTILRDSCHRTHPAPPPHFRRRPRSARLGDGRVDLTHRNRLGRRPRPVHTTPLARCRWARVAKQDRSLEGNGPGCFCARSGHGLPQCLPRPYHCGQVAHIHGRLTTTCFYAPGCRAPSARCRWHRPRATPGLLVLLVHSQIETYPAHSVIVLTPPRVQRPPGRRASRVPATVRCPVTRSRNLHPNLAHRPPPIRFTASNQAPCRRWLTHLSHRSKTLAGRAAEHGGEHRSQDPTQMLTPALSAFAVPPAMLFHDLLLLIPGGD